jgi:thiol:disulfide interchange protein DsbD
MNTSRPSWCWPVLAVLAFLLAAMPAHAQSEEDPSPHSEAELIAEHASIQPGEPFTAALRMTMESGWHSYWKNPGDAGQATSIDWSLPEGFETEGIQWPYPHRIPFGSLTSYGYSDEVVLPVRVTPPETLKSKTITLDGTANWLVCADICLPAKSEISLSLPVRAGTPAPNEASRKLIAEAKSKMPVKKPDWQARASRSAGSYALKVTPPDGASVVMDSAHFFPGEKAVLDHAAPQPVSQDGDAHVMALQQSEYAQEPADSLSGVLVVPTEDDATQAVTISAPVDTVQAVGTAAGGGTSDASMTLLAALLFAFVGGLILNLMPCVFPILSVKVLGFAQQSDERDASIRRHGLTFGAGVVTSFWALAGLLLVFRAGGAQVGWGFQLQSPFFVALMAMLFFGIGLNLLGVFEVGGQLMSWGGRAERSASGGLGGSFWSGVLATVVATPCTAPLMGAALGFALTLPVMSALAVFTALGLGMAAPYVLLSMAPRFVKRLPEPGTWMETLRQVLAFPMFATTIWLVWVLGQQTGISGMTFLLAGLLLLGAAAWVAGRWDARRLSGAGRWAVRGMATLVLAGAVAMALIGADYERSATSGSATQTASSSESAWQQFSPEKVKQLRSNGRPVFVDFTAAWCLTCQVNKRTTLSTQTVQQAFAENEVALLKADWTNRDAEITRALKQHGRSGVPLYVLYDGTGSEPTLLPEILTKDIVLDALGDLPDSEGTPSPERAATKNQKLF